jgi:hypothetical protein
MTNEQATFCTPPSQTSDKHGYRSHRCDTISALAAKADIWLEIRKSPINDDFTRNPNGNTSLRPLFSAADRIPHRLLARVAIRGLAHGEVR